RTAGAAAPAEPSAGSFGLEVEDISPPIPPLEDDGLAGAAQARVEKLARTIRKTISAGDPASAHALLTSGEFSRLADDVTYDRAAQTVAFAYFLKGKAKTALDLAAKAAARSGDDVPLAQWTAGLAAYKLERYAAAEPFFAALALNRSASARQRAAGGYWAFRAAKAVESVDQAQRYLRGAAEYPTTFYGLLAHAALGRPIKLNWNQPGLSPRERDELLRYPEVRRALALVQVGQRRLAEQEFSSLDPARDPGRALTVLGLATRLGLPATEIRLGYGLADNWEARYLAALYPVPLYRPRDGFEIDRALLFAFMRQESAFNAFARSSAGAVGLMQLMPRTAAFIGRDRTLADKTDTRLLDPEFNLALGQSYIAHLMAEPDIGRNLMFVAAAYNAGPGNLRKWRKGKTATGDPLMFLESLPSAETRHFVQQVMTNFWLYRARLGQDSPSLREVALNRWPTYDVQDKRQLAAYAGN
ncbi:MAG: lytic transglycosylase domain-containing protein, partial [Alphaproteobacteria bacterium]